MVDVIDSIPEGFAAGNCFNWLWCRDVLDNVRYSKSMIALESGLNELKITAIDPGLVIQKLVLTKDGSPFPKTYLGPKESWRQE